MLDFIKENLQYLYLILACISIVINIIILKLKKVPLTKVIKCVSLIPTLIANAEKVFPLSDEGNNKHDLVKSLFNDILVAYGVERYAKYIDVDNIIEEVLEAPQKKGVD